MGAEWEWEGRERGRELLLQREQEGERKEEGLSQDGGYGKIQRKLCSCTVSREIGGAVRTSMRGCPIQHTRGVSKEQAGSHRANPGGEGKARRRGQQDRCKKWASTKLWKRK